MEQRWVSTTHTRTNLNIITMQFKDCDKKAIEAKLKQVEDFETKYGENDMSRSWRKWCESHEYRRREWLWRQNLAAANEELNNTIYHEERFI